LTLWAAAKDKLVKLLLIFLLLRLNMEALNKCQPQQSQGLLVQPPGDWHCLLRVRLLALLWALHLLVLVQYQALLLAQALQPLQGCLVIQLLDQSIVYLEQNTHCPLMQWKTCSPVLV
jgi:hypothetical protein